MHTAHRWKVHGSCFGVCIRTRMCAANSHVCIPSNALWLGPRQEGKEYGVWCRMPPHYVPPSCSHIMQPLHDGESPNVMLLYPDSLCLLTLRKCNSVLRIAKFTINPGNAENQLASVRRGLPVPEKFNFNISFPFLFILFAGAFLVIIKTSGIAH